jgi:hypothetical protein
MTAQQLAVHLYERALRCYPGTFRRAFADSMLADFIDATADAAATGPRAVVMCWCRAALDLARSLARQWLRRPQPWLVLAGMLGAIVCVQTVVLPVPQPPAAVPAPASEDEARLLVLIVIAAFFPVVSVIVFVGSFLPLLRRGPGRRA